MDTRQVFDIPKITARAMEHQQSSVGAAADQWNQAGACPPGMHALGRRWWWQKCPRLSVLVDTTGLHPTHETTSAVATI
jgi:hypothetical protein